jgi:hypothetical protein
LTVDRAAATALLAAVLLACGVARAQSVRVVPDRTSIALGETVTVQIVLSGKFDDARGPDIPDFDVAGRSSGSSISIVNGVVTQEQQVTLSLAPKRAGVLAIGAIELVAGGRVVASSKPVSIRVSGRGAVPPSPSPAPGAAPPGPQEAPEPSPPPAAAGASVPERYAGSRWFVLARVTDRPVFAGEPVYVEYVLFVQQNVGLSDAQVEGAPSMKGFVVSQPAGNPPPARRVVVGGVAYNAHVVWRAALTALGPGKAVLPSVNVILSVGDRFFAQRRRATSEPVELDFRPVPSQGRPADFVEGTVGRFVVTARLDKTAVRVGDSAVLTVEVSGAGNLQAIKRPEVRGPEGLRVSVVPAADLDEVVVNAGGISGRRAFQYLLTPEREGEIDVGRVEVPFFDPLQARFDRSRTEPLKIVATPRGGGPIQEARGEPIVSIVASSDLAPAPEAPVRAPVTVALAWAGITLPVAGFLFADLAARRRGWLARNGASVRKRQALSRARSDLASLARDRSLGPAAFWGELDRVLREFVDRRFDVVATGLTQADLAAALGARGAPAGAIEVLVAELDGCAFGRFAPSAAQERDRATAVERARACLAALDRVREPG